MEAKDLWNLTALTYDQAQERYAQERYPQHVYRYRRVFEMIDAACRALGSHRDGELRLLDVGCGYGDILRYAAGKGIRATGIDVVPDMVELARSKLKDVANIDVRVGDATDLRAFRAGSFDIVCVIQVFGYIPAAQQATYMTECNRILKAGGHLITADVNSIFDMATFNKFTVNFFAEQLLPLGFGDPAQRQKLLQEIRGLLTRPDEPKAPAPPHGSKSYVDTILDDKEARYGSHRDQYAVTGNLGNPLEYPSVLSMYGFKLSDLAFYHFYAVPPLLFYKHPELERVAETLEDKYCRSWQGYFMASCFVASAIKEKRV